MAESAGIPGGSFSGDEATFRFGAGGRAETPGVSAHLGGSGGAESRPDLGEPRRLLGVSAPSRRRPNCAENRRSLGTAACAGLGRDAQESWPQLGGAELRAR